MTRMQAAKTSKVHNVFFLAVPIIHNQLCAPITVASWRFFVMSKGHFSLASNKSFIWGLFSIHLQCHSCN